jgi:hypothetical protein
VVAAEMSQPDGPTICHGIYGHMSDHPEAFHGQGTSRLTVGLMEVMHRESAVEMLSLKRDIETNVIGLAIVVADRIFSISSALNVQERTSGTHVDLQAQTKASIAHQP